MGFPGGSDGEESSCNAGDSGLIPEYRCVFHGALRGGIVREKNAHRLICSLMLISVGKNLRFKYTALYYRTYLCWETLNF